MTKSIKLVDENIEEKCGLEFNKDSLVRQGIGSRPSTEFKKHEPETCQRQYVNECI